MAFALTAGQAVVVPITVFVRNPFYTSSLAKWDRPW
jgi:hypothetical protein